MKQRGSFIILGVWCLISIAVELFHDGLKPESVTRLLVLAFFSVNLLWFFKWGRFIEVKHPNRTFIVWCVMNAMAVELFYMISKPLSPSLLIAYGMPPSQAARNTAVDLVLTLPAYVIIFFVIWLLERRFHYSPFSFFSLMALGQALGDGGAFFLTNPGALVLIPCVMLNYWAMNFVPYLVTREKIPHDRNWRAIVLPLVGLPIAYFATGGIIMAVGRKLGWI